MASIPEAGGSRKSRWWSRIEFWGAVIGFVGAIVGAIIGAYFTTHWTIDANTRDVVATAQRIADLNKQIDDIRKLGVPVGTIVASTLTREEFLGAAGDNLNLDPKNKWALADGGPAQGTDYAKTAHKAVLPDLRAVFLHGKKNDRSQDPSGNSIANVEEIGLGEYRADIVGPHIHDQYLHVDKDAKTGEMGMRWDGFSNLNSPVIVREWNHGGENIPKNVTVNYFIRINP